MTGTICIRGMNVEDVNEVIKVHLQSFKGFFLTFLGPAFLRALYEGILLDPTGIAFVCTNDQGMLGFVAGTSHPSGFYRRLLYKRWWRFGLASLGAVLRQPWVIKRLLRAFTLAREDPELQSCGTLMSIAVLPSAEGKGAGRALVREFLAEARRRGLVYVNLTTDKENNERTNKFYQKLGFQCARSYLTPEGRAMNEYLISLSESNP